MNQKKSYSTFSKMNNKNPNILSSDMKLLPEAMKAIKQILFAIFSFKTQSEQKENGSFFQSSTARQLLAVSALSLGCFLDGIVLAYSSPALPSIDKDINIEITEHHKSWIGSAHSLGAILGSLISIPLLDMLGRKGASLYIMSMAYIVGFLLIGLAPSASLIIVGRFIGGVGLGLTLSLSPVYLVEVTSLDNRGMLGVVPPLFTQVGILYTYVAGIYLDWRWLSLTGVSLGFVFILCVWFIPESPLYLASKSKVKAAEAALEWLGRKGDSSALMEEVESY